MCYFKWWDKAVYFFVTVVDIGVVAFDVLLYPNVSKCIVVFSYHVKKQMLYWTKVITKHFLSQTDVFIPEIFNICAKNWKE